MQCEVAGSETWSIYMFRVDRIDAQTGVVLRLQGTLRELG